MSLWAYTVVATQQPYSSCRLGDVSSYELQDLAQENMGVPGNLPVHMARQHVPQHSLQNILRESGELFRPQEVVRTTVDATAATLGEGTRWAAASLLRVCLA